MANNTSWFAVDKDGLKQMFSAFPPERMVFELTQNSWDLDRCSTCAIHIEHTKEGKLPVTNVTVVDDHPEGFKNIADAYTLFRSTDKRGDPTKRGRFNFGEKIVLARALRGLVTTTKGTVAFDDKGRHESDTRRKAGSEIWVQFPQWSKTEAQKAVDMLKAMYPPAAVRTFLHLHEGMTELKHTTPLKTITVSLPTEYIKDIDGHSVLTKTSRKTEVHFHAKRLERAHLCEMGLPICEIDGKWDIDVQQKVPLSQDRTLVPSSYLQDIYAEMLVAMKDEIDATEMGSSHIKAALEDERVDPTTAASIFKKQFGDNAVIQSDFDPDANQEAARAGAQLVSSRTFGSEVNGKLRQGGVSTATESYSRDRTQLEADDNLPLGFKEIAPEKETEQRANLRRYTEFLAERFYGKKVKVTFATWLSQTAAIYEHGKGITYNVRHPAIASMSWNVVSKGTATVLHELAHCMGTGHDGVYDHEFESLVNKHTLLLATDPECYEEFEPGLWQKD